MSKATPYWLPEADYSHCPFFIRRMNTTGFIKCPEVPSASLPLLGFVYLTGGELLADVSGKLHLCFPGQLLLIPVNVPFSIRYYKDAVGFTGGISLSILSDGYRPPRQTVLQAFWFDEAAFVGELFNMMLLSYEKSNLFFVERALALLLPMVKTESNLVLPQKVSRFLEMAFDKSAPILRIADYAGRLSMTPNGLGRAVRNATGRNLGSWIEEARLSHAKRLLKDTSLPIIDIAAAVGLDDQSYFARFFKRNTGMTPSAFRHSHEKS